MSRRPLDVGSYGSISYRALGRRKVRARCKVRDADGVIRDVTCEGTSNADARDNLLEKIERRPGFTGSELTSESTVEDALRLWLDELDRKADNGEIALNTPRTYRSVIDSHVRAGVGALKLREATPPRLDAFVVAMRSRHGVSVTKTARTVLNGVLGLAVRHGALKTNPMRDVGRVTAGRRATKRKPRAMTQLERADWLAKMEADEVASIRDLPDITRFLLATGVRIAECLAVTFDELDVDAKLVRIDWQIIRVTGRGLLRVSTKSSAGDRTLSLPGWAVDMVIRRGERLGWSGPLFPIPKQRRGGQRWQGGIWRDPNNTSRDLRQARDEAGYGWVTSHVFRKTVATVMTESGFSAREVADQLGHSKISMTQDVYFGRDVVSHGGAALEDMFGERDEETPGE
jgi:integrase